MAIQEGRPAPPFTLEDGDGKPVSLSDFRGKDLVLYFYPRDETPGCTKEACGFRDLWKEIRAEGAEVVGVSPDSGESHRKFVANHRLPFRLLSDPSRKMMTLYGAFGEKMMYGKTTKGVIRSTVWIGPDGKVKKHWSRVQSAADHPAQVLEAIRGS
jgi:peroxiredoxin Q/BCP